MPSRVRAAATPADRAVPEVRIAIRLKPTARETSRDSDDAIRQALAEPLANRGLRSRIGPLLVSVTPSELAGLIQLACERDPTYVPPPLDAWRQVVLLPGSRARPEAHLVDTLVNGLQGLGAVDDVYALRAGPPPEVHPGDDRRSAYQGYLDPAPCGVDARYAWTKGWAGAGIGFVDLEQGWKLNHEDLVDARVPLISGVNKDFLPHGTAVLGVVLMVDNLTGGVGIAPHCTGRVISQYRDNGAFNTADAIVDAARRMQPGDVLLLEAQEYDPISGTYSWPVEIARGPYECIRLATALGIVVIEAGGNGKRDLDAYVSAAGARIFDRHFRDSLAVMVGAAESSGQHARWEDPDPKSRSGSNFGSRIDCYGWGDSIDTAWTDDAGIITDYTPNFRGTSGASAIVAGAALVVQSLARAGTGRRPLTPRELREAIVAGGTPSAWPPADRIGVMPNLRAIIEGSALPATARPRT